MIWLMHAQAIHNQCRGRDIDCGVLSHCPRGFCIWRLGGSRAGLRPASGGCVRCWLGWSLCHPSLGDV